MLKKEKKGYTGKPELAIPADVSHPVDRKPLAPVPEFDSDEELPPAPILVRTTAREVDEDGNYIYYDEEAPPTQMPEKPPILVRKKACILEDM